MISWALIFNFCLFIVHAAPPLRTMENIEIASLWNGNPIEDHDVKVKMTFKTTESHMEIRILAPYFADPSPPNATREGGSYYKLWDYEVTEMFFLNKETSKYLELEFGPGGQYLVLLLDGRRNSIDHGLSLEYEATIDETEGTWSGFAKVPLSYFPPKVDSFNAYAIHGVGNDRRFESLFPAKGEQPDFHELESFKTLPGKTGADLQNITKLSDIWCTALEEKKISTV